MHRRSRAEIVDFSEGNNDDNNDDSKAYCNHCKKFGFLIELKNRIYLEDQPIPSDHDQWRQCYNCGSIVPVYELERETSIKDVVETVENPFDIAKNSFLGIDSRASSKKMKRQRDRERELDHIKDDDLKRELRKGNTLISYIEYQPQ